MNDLQPLATAYLQSLLDIGGEVTVPQGEYLTGPLYIKSGTTLDLTGVTLRASTDESVWGLIPTRVAGIETEWYPAVLNVLQGCDVTVLGGTIDGQGAYWWNKYWGTDGKGGMCRLYDERGMRWACDYDCRRPRNLLISRSENVRIKGLVSRSSGFWNVHILYSRHVLAEDVTVDSHGGLSPSTDGIDIDSSSFVTIRRCTLNCNDDNIAVKSGRDADGLRVGIPSHDILIRDCRFLSGYGITIGSECSGGVENVTVQNAVFLGTDCGFRIKSAYPRKGYIRHIRLNNLSMRDVGCLFHLYLNWNPDYNTCTLPASYRGEIFPHYQQLMAPVDDEIPPTRVEDIVVDTLTATLSPAFSGTSKVFTIEGYAEQPIANLVFRRLDVRANEWGSISHVRNMKTEACSFSLGSADNQWSDFFDVR